MCICTCIYIYMRISTWIEFPRQSGFWERFAGIRSRLGRGGNDRAVPSERLPRHERTPSNKPATSQLDAKSVNRSLNDETDPDRGISRCRTRHVRYCVPRAFASLVAAPNADYNLFDACNTRARTHAGRQRQADDRAGTHACMHKYEDARARDIIPLRNPTCPSEVEPASSRDTELFGRIIDTTCDARGELGDTAEKRRR